MEKLKADCFKAGAKWMAEQGLIYEDKVYPTTYENEPTEYCLDGGKEVKLVTKAVKDGILKKNGIIKELRRFYEGKKG